MYNIHKCIIVKILLTNCQNCDTLRNNSYCKVRLTERDNIKYQGILAK